MDCSMPDFQALHCLPKFAQTHVHWGADAITVLIKLNFIYGKWGWANWYKRYKLAWKSPAMEAQT